MNNKIKNLDFLKIVGCFAVLGYHFFSSNRAFSEFIGYSFFAQANQFGNYGFYAVELFFMLSGFFFALNLDTTKSLWQFLKKKLIRLYPVLVFMLLVAWLGAVVFKLYDLNIYDSIFTLFALNGTGFVYGIGDWNTGACQFWYVSAMLWVLTLYFYLLKNYAKKNVNLVLALLVFFAYSILMYFNKGKNPMPLPLLGGMYRAVAGIGVGYFIAEWYKQNKEYIQNIILNIYQTLFVTLIEFLCVFFVVENLLFHKTNFDNDLIYIVVFILTIVLFLCNKGFISRALNLNIFSFLVKYVYSIYMVHCFVVYNLHNSFFIKNKEFVINHPMPSILLAYGLSIFFGVLVYYFIEKPATKYLIKHWE